tara:strand:- start:223 stop:477 length:255 start_codon:yes stop_codon:yes gene_type:complete
MIDRIIKIISILSFLMSISMAAFGYVAIRYMKSPEFERTLKNKIMGSLEDKLPDVMGDKMPDFTGPSVQLPEPLKVNPLGNPKN